MLKVKAMRQRILSIFVCFILAALSLLAVPGITSPVLAAKGAAMSDAYFLSLCKQGSLNEIKAAIDGGANVNAKDEEGRTPLSLAAFSNGDPEVITALAKAGADLNARSNINWTPLYWAAWDNANPDIITALAAAGANVNARDAGGLTPLMVAIRFNENPAVITALLNAGANASEQDMNGCTPLMWAASHGGERENKPEIIAAMLNAGADPNIKDRDGRRAADYAKGDEEFKSTEVYKKLLVPDAAPETGGQPSARGGAENIPNAALEKEFASFLQKFSEDEAFQRRHTRQPLAMMEVDNDRPDYKVIMWHQSRREVRFPIMPLSRERKEQSLEIRIDSLTDKEADVSVSVPETDYLLLYFFRKENSWLLEQEANWSL